jgi:hypothetical protein
MLEQPAASVIRNLSEFNVNVVSVRADVREVHCFHAFRGAKKSR